MADLLDDYDGASAWDEMLDPSGLPRASYAALHHAWAESLV